MQNVKALWTTLDPMRKALAVLATLAVFGAVLGLARMASAPSMALLYAGLDGRQAGEVIAALDRQAASYEIRGDAIFVDALQRDALRMQLAGEGLPQSTGAGYELLDGLSGFGTTSQMFDAAYWRAKEGELARTILSSPAVRQARVHIANPAPGPFQRTRNSTASVTVTARGGPIPEETADAFRYLVASAVQGLSPADVAVIDATTGRVIGSDDGSAAGAASGDRAETLKANVARLLEAQVGPGNAVVEVSVETVTDAESIRERRIDPESRVAISTDVEDVSTTEQNGGNAGVTVASNLPDGAAASGNNTSQSQNSESRALTNFDLSETTREVERRPGAIKRLTVAVLINSARGGAADPAALGDLRELVASAVGYDESRGDQITVKAMPFEPRPDLGTAASEGLFDTLRLDPLRLIQIGVLAVTALALGLFVVRPVLRSTRSPEGEGARAFPLIDGRVVDATTLDGVTTGPGGEGAIVPVEATGGSLPAVADPAFAGLRRDLAEDSPVESLKRLIEERQPDTIEILRTWLEDDSIEETA